MPIKPPAQSPAQASPPSSSSQPLSPSFPADPFALQREAARKQAQSVGAHLIPWTPIVDPPSDCIPLADNIVNPLIDAAARREQVDPKLIRAVIEQESAVKPCAVSPKGAEGLMQLMPGTAADLAVSDAFDPGQNIDAGARYLKLLLDKYKGNLAQALAAYNAGPAEVDKVGGIPNIAETKTYVDSILHKLPAPPPKTPDQQSSGH